MVVSRFLFRSGNPEHLDDIFHDTTVQVHPEVLPQTPPTGLPALQGSMDAPAPGFLIVGQFNDDGLAEGRLPAALGNINVVRLQVGAKSPNWVILSEVRTA